MKLLFWNNSKIYNSYDENYPIIFKNYNYEICWFYCVVKRAAGYNNFCDKN